MENASKNQNYEEAAEIRDRIQAITAITSKQETTDSNSERLTFTSSKLFEVSIKTLSIPQVSIKK